MVKVAPHWLTLDLGLYINKKYSEYNLHGIVPGEGAQGFSLVHSIPRTLGHRKGCEEVLVGPLQAPSPLRMCRCPGRSHPGY